MRRPRVKYADTGGTRAFLAAIYADIISRALTLSLARDRDKSDFLAEVQARKRWREIDVISGKVRNTVHLLASYEMLEYRVCIFVAEKLPLSRTMLVSILVS